MSDTKRTLTEIGAELAADLPMVAQWQNEANSAYRTYRQRERQVEEWRMSLSHEEYDILQNQRWPIYLWPATVDAVHAAAAMTPTTKPSLSTTSLVTLSSSTGRTCATNSTQERNSERHQTHSNRDRR